MGSTRKRGRQEMENGDAVQSEQAREPTMLERIRNMWEFANLAQYIYLFGKAVKIDEDLGIEELEIECLKSNSDVLPSIGLALLKFVSSHRGLTPEIFDEYTRRQYMAKAPQRNPFGIEEAPVSFAEFDIFTKIRVLQQLSQWTLGNPDRIRERMVDDQKDEKQTLWRIEAFGWDSEDRTYIVLDDDRLYRRTDPPPPPPPAPKPKKNSRRSKANSRASKRRKVSEPVEEEHEEVVEDNANSADDVVEDDGLGGAKWECLAVGLGELNAFLATIEKTRDPNEKMLRKRLTDDLLPLLAKREEARQRKEAQKQRELMNLEKLATAKRSSRIAGKLEQQKQDEEVKEAERRKQADLAMAKKEQQKWSKLERERESRMQTREQRLREREARRILHEEELSQLSEDSKKVEAGEARGSERHIKAEIERKKKALEEINEEEDWIFDCICGAYGQIDDGTHSISCEKCSVWQHSKCLGVSQAEAERDDFHFVCSTCKRRAEDVEKSKSHPIKIKLGRPSSSSSSTPVAHPANGSTPSFAAQFGNGNHESPSPRNGPLPFQTRHASEDDLPYNNKPNGHTVQQPSSFSSQATNSMSGNDARPKSQASSSNGAIKNSSFSASMEAPLPRPISVVGPNVFSSPASHSPTSLPPPAQPKMYSFVNGHSGQPYFTNCSQADTKLASPHALNKSNSQTPLPPPSGSPYYYKSQYPPQNSNIPGERRSSTSFPSPLASAPILTPRQYNNSPSTPGLPQYNTELHRSSQLPTSSPSKHSSPLPSPYTQSLQTSDHTTTLPPTMSGLSPTKHSPPRPTTSNGSFEHATPSVLPPVAPLLPSSPVQNLSPPVKPADPEYARQMNAYMSADQR